jgi:hypothetical protein
MVGRSAGDGRFSSVKAQRAKVKVFNKNVNDSNWVIIGNIIFQILGKQCALHSAIAFNKPFHLSSSSRVVLGIILQGFQWGSLRFDTAWTQCRMTINETGHVYDEARTTPALINEFNRRRK